MKKANSEVNKGQLRKLEAQIQGTLTEINDLVQKQCKIRNDADLEAVENEIAATTDRLAALITAWSVERFFAMSQVKVRV